MDLEPGVFEVDLDEAGGAEGVEEQQPILLVGPKKVALWHTPSLENIILFETIPSS